MSDDRDFWNSAYDEGIDYRQLSDGDVAAIVSSLPGESGALLDIGCGNGRLARQFYALGFNVTGVDLSEVAVESARELSGKKLNFAVFDIENGDTSRLGKFDVVTMKLVFAFLQDKGSVIEKINEMLNPGGAFVVINPMITDISKASVKERRISVDDGTAMSIENFGFTLKSRKAAPISDHHELVTYIFWKD